MTYYVGLTKYGRICFRSAIRPTEWTHGKQYLAVIGPFRTKRAAIWAESQEFNPHFQNVNDAERISASCAD